MRGWEQFAVLPEDGTYIEMELDQHAKIEATIHGAKIFEAMKNEAEDFGRWVWSLHGEPMKNSGSMPAKTQKSEEISKALKKRGFKFVGPTIVYAWMQAVGMVDDHCADCFRRK